MGKLRRYYNQNRKKIWRIIIIVAFAFALLYFANNIAKRKTEQAMENIIAQNEKNKKNQVNNVDNNYVSQLEQSNVQTKSTTTQTDVIRQFVSYCNKKDLENAYNMITDDCKEQMFNDLETFERIYYNSAFENKAKDVSIDKWTGNTYLVYLNESALATGKSTNENQKGDYITVVKDNNNYKLNINSYIGQKMINKTKEQEDIKIEVICKNAYMNYEEYTIKVTNESEEQIMLDMLYGVESIYLEDSNGMKYPYSGNELSQELLTVDKGHIRELKIKFYNSYSSLKDIKALVFSSVMKGNKQINYKITF